MLKHHVVAVVSPVPRVCGEGIVLRGPAEREATQRHCIQPKGWVRCLCFLYVGATPRNAKLWVCVPLLL